MSANDPKFQEVQQAPKLVITMVPGGVQLEGPLQNKGLCHMLLGQALEVLIKYEPGKADSAHPTLLLGRPA